MNKTTKDLLIVDGYNVIYKSDRYTSLMDTPAKKDLSHDPFMRAREQLVADVAAYAQGRYQAVIVFDGSGNVNEDRPSLKMAGIPLVFSKTGQTADSVIEKYVTQARQKGQTVSVVTSDNTIRATIGTGGVTRISSDLFIKDVSALSQQTQTEAAERAYSKMTVEDRLDKTTLAKLNAILGRKI